KVLGGEGWLGGVVTLSLPRPHGFPMNCLPGRRAGKREVAAIAVVLRKQPPGPRLVLAGVCVARVATVEGRPPGRGRLRRLRGVPSRPARPGQSQAPLLCGVTNAPAAPAVSARTPAALAGRIPGRTSACGTPGRPACAPSP